MMTKHTKYDIDSILSPKKYIVGQKVNYKNNEYFVIQVLKNDKYVIAFDNNKQIVSASELD